MKAQTAEIQWIGFDQKSTLPASHINVLTPPDKELLQEGDFCDCLYSVDGKYYDCVIEKIADTGYQVRFKQYKTKETVPIEYLKITPQQKKHNKKRADDELTTFDFPEAL